MTLEDELKGKAVIVEAQLYGGDGTVKNQLYWGKYRGIETLGDKDVLVLAPGTYRNVADINITSTESPKVKAHLLIIPLNHVMSVAYELVKGEQK